jgi:predicted thioesterase
MTECARYRWEQKEVHAARPPEHLAIRFKDAMLPQVLATPVMILIMENALSAIRTFLDIGESAVGTAIMYGILPRRP